MKLAFQNLRCAADPEAGGNGRASKEVKVRASGKQPLCVDGIHIPVKGEVLIHEKHLKRLGDMVTKVVAIAALLLLGSLTAGAQLYQNTYVPLTNGSAVRLTGNQTNAVGGTLTVSGLGGTNQINVVIPVTKYDDISFYFGSKPLSASTSNNVVTVDQSLEGTNWFPLGQVAWLDGGTAFTGNGTNFVVKATGYVRVTQWATTNSLVVKTNLTGNYAFKPSRFGN